MSLDTIPRVRSSDPLTSFLAADAARKFRPSHVDRILASLRQHGASTPARIGEITGLTVVQVDRRLVEMQRDGLIELVMVFGRPLVIGGYRVWKAA